MDKKNPILKLIHKGMEAEQGGSVNRAYELFARSWYDASNDWEKCIAAHFVARHQGNLEDKLKWNMESLNRANKVNNDEIRGYYPSLYLNIGVSYEDLGNYKEAKRYYNLAFDKISDLPSDIDNEKYSKGIREDILEKKVKLGVLELGQEKG